MGPAASLTMAGIFSKLFTFLRRKSSGSGGKSTTAPPFSGRKIRSSSAPAAPLPRRGGGSDRRQQKIEARLKSLDEAKEREARRLAELRAKLDARSQAEFDKLVGRTERGATVDMAEWHRLNSSNVDRIRYGTFDRLLQVVFKDGSLYEYQSVEPEVFQRFLTTHSPGQFVWYVLRAYGYRYRRVNGAGSHGTTLPAADRFSGHPFAVPDDVQAVERRAGRGAVDVAGVVTSKGVRPPPLPSKFWRK